MQNMNRIGLLLVIAAGALAGGLAAVTLLPGSPHGTASSGKALIGGPFSLVDQTGKRVSDTDFRGRKMLVYFGFTSCPDVCPAGLQVIAAALDTLGAKADKLTPIFITVDPERDPPEKMALYVKSFHPRLVGLSGSSEEVAAAAKAYRVYFKKIPDEQTPGSYSVDHSSFLYLMDEKGEYIRHFTYPIDAGVLAAELAKAL